ncbi:MAG: VanZ family protein [Burkholderiaceae bacterium]
MVWATSDPKSTPWWRWLLAALLVTVSWLALSPAPPHALDSGWDKLNHAGAFAVLMLTGVFASPRSRIGVLALLIGLFCFGALIEVAQSFTPTRSAEWGDLLADLVGMAAGGLAAMLVTRWGTAQLR